MRGQTQSETARAERIQYEQAAEAYIETRLSNPRGARIQIVGQPYPVIAQGQGLSGVACLALDMRVKARLPSGGYGSTQTYTVLFQDGVAVALKSDLKTVVRA